MKPALLKEVIEKIKSVRIAVIGDFCLDAYFFIDNSMSEISVETGLPTTPVQGQRYSLGGAGNLANNMITLGVKEVRTFGVTGNDLFGREMLMIMQKAGISTDSMLIQEENWATHVYCKPYINDAEQSRIDFGNFNVLNEKTSDQLINNLQQEIEIFDIIVINQQVPSGIHTVYFREKLKDLISHHPDKIFITDIRDKSRSFQHTYLKLNDTEAASLCGFDIDTASSVTWDQAREAAGILYARNKKPVFVTCGSRGSLAIDAEGITDVPGLMHFGQVDPVGAGDSYLAGSAASLAAGYSVGISAEIGSLVAAVTVRKLFQTGTASPEELFEIGKDPDYIYKPELAEDIRKARYLENTEIEIINSLPDKLQIKHAIFDHDGTISTLREGWEQIMAPMMIKAVLGNAYNTTDKATFDKVKESVENLIDQTTGVQTLAQMAALVELVRNFGFIPEDEILDIYGYKNIYNEELLRLVHIRENKLQKGEISLEDVTLKNAIPFLQALYNAGIKLYLASGTDQEDVVNEARVLGYDHFFEGRIFGSVGDLKKDAKKIVLENILNTIGKDQYKQIITFGDGPVEIRETRKTGGITAGVASNEIKRFCLNEKKRTRLIKAGADIIIPDFSQLRTLLGLLHV